MAATLAALVGQMHNHLSASLHGGQYSYSLEQIADEFVQKRGETLLYLEGKGESPLLTSAAQRLDGLVLKPRDWIPTSEAASYLLANLPVPAHRVEWLYAKVPRLLDLKADPVVYLGPAGRPQRWEVIRDPMHLQYQQHRAIPRRTPLCYVDGNDLWVTNPTGTAGSLPRLLRMLAVFADPREPFQLKLTTEEHRIFVGADDDQTDDTLTSGPDFPLDPETTEKVRLRLINLFLGTHGNRPLNPNTGNPTI